MTKQELWQIGVAVVSAQSMNLNGFGHVTPVATVLGILNSHCADAQLKAEVDGDKNTLTLVGNEAGR